MTAGDRYRRLAAEFEERAQGGTDPAKIIEFRSLAGSYRRLAAQADVNDKLDLIYETPPPRE